MAKIQFLKFPLASIRRSIKDIDDSYRNPWDMYAELAQNSVDAIRKMQADCDEKGQIKITVNSQEKSIIFEDNGCGISFEDLPQLLNLFSSGKVGDTSSVGEKGVGLKFVMFQSTEFEIRSSDGKTGGIATVKDARLWKKSKSEDELMLDVNELQGLSRGTKISMKGIELERDDNEEIGTSLFNLSFEQFKYILRSKTFLGETTYLWEKSTKPIEIIIKYTDFNGVNYEEVLKNEYILPTEVLSAADIVDIDEFEAWLSEKDRTDTDKRAKLQGKILTLKGTYLHNNYRKISYWVCFLPTRRDWDFINKELKLLPEGDVGDEWLESNAFCLVNSGIYTATKGMPTGIAISHPNSGNAGYWSNFFMIFQDDALTFDIGRKSIHGKVQAIYQAKAKELFNRITKYVTKYTSSVPVTPGPSDFDRDEIVEEVKGLPNLNSKIAAFEKLPSEQEASVSAIFFELIGNKVIDDITPIYLGYRNKYDLYAYYTSKQTKKKKFGFYEFKSHLRHLTKDFADARKVFDEIDYVICWDVNDTDILQLNNFGINCEELEKGKLHEYDCPSSITHILTIPNCNPVYVIDLKKLV
ncbi:MAG: ATP-binding protein [Lachnospiraceae bacterium]|nr:ATP-binding protein [Lachnospiraceae bacterium]